ncbi:hypothetical protein HOK31_13115 [Candidatus Poribacteria bacterium]|jgi:hypothetical protein|nr:hypothetical protein [Candidatus Poribacteria bacterium]MBT5710107.1 hypothetical protein [Candidatus Poribacteria bacterium]MBT7806165.1 hypothetical protein [Candidatus Poribacteria bacterium]
MGAALTFVQKHREFLLSLAMFAVAAIGLVVARNQVRAANSQRNQARVTRTMGQYAAFLNALNELPTTAGRWLIAYWGWCRLVAKVKGHTAGHAPDELAEESLEERRRADDARAAMNSTFAEWRTHQDILTPLDADLARRGVPVIEWFEAITDTTERWRKGEEAPPDGVVPILRELDTVVNPARERVQQVLSQLLQEEGADFR